MLRGEWLDEKPWEFRAPSGTEFKAERSDLRSGVTLRASDDSLTEEQFVKDVARAIGFHSQKILPHIENPMDYGEVDFAIEWV